MHKESQFQINSKIAEVMLQKKSIRNILEAQEKVREQARSNLEHVESNRKVKKRVTETVIFLDK